MSEVLFFVAAIGALAGAIGVVALRNPFYSVLSLVFHLLSLAALFLLLRAEFVAAAQVVVYAGAVMVLYVFVVAYVGGDDEPIHSPGPGLRVAAPIFAGMLAVELFIALLGTGLKGVHTEGSSQNLGFGTAHKVGEMFLTKFLFAFEIASILLLVAAVGAVILARRRRGLPGGEEEAALPAIPMPEGAGSMREAVGMRPGGTVEPAVGARGLDARRGW